MISTALRFSLLALTLLLVSCTGDADNDQSQFSSIPFGIDEGIVLGMLKDDLQNHHKMRPCELDGNDRAKCQIDDFQKGKEYHFLGKTGVSLIEVGLHKPYTTVDSISFYISKKHRPIKKEDIEKAWNVTGKCLSGKDVDNVRKYDKISSNMIHELSEIKLFPYGDDSFICLAENNNFLEYSYYKDGGSASVKIFYLKGSFAQAVKMILTAKERYESAKKEVDAINAIPPPQSNPSSPTRPSADISALMEEAQDLNSQCRGGSGDEQETWKACEKRDAAYEKVRKTGWCWGSRKADAVGAELDWLLCSEDAYGQTEDKQCIPTNHAKVPPMAEFTYHEGRKALIANGWQPVQTVRWQEKNEKLFGQASDFWEKGYVEVEDCAGTGLAPCIFLFRDVYGNHLRVTTAGEEIPEEKGFAMVTGFEFVCQP